MRPTRCQAPTSEETSCGRRPVTHFDTWWETYLCEGCARSSHYQDAEPLPAETEEDAS